MQKKPVVRKSQSVQKPLVKKAPEPVVEPVKQNKGFTAFPSAKFTSIKTIDPFAEKKGNSFAHVYSAGSIPCKINHGSVSMKLQWNKDVVIANLPYDPLIVTCFEGLMEEAHPYSFIAYNVIKDMILDESSSEKLIPILQKLVWPLRAALGSKKEDIAERALDSLKYHLMQVRLLSDKVGSHLNSSVKSLVTPMVKHMNNKKLKDKVYVALQALEDNGGGPEVYKIIKAAIPTYSNT